MYIYAASLSLKLPVLVCRKVLKVRGSCHVYVILKAVWIARYQLLNLFFALHARIRRFIQ